MIVFLLPERIKHYMIDYLEHIEKYLKQGFRILVKIVIYENSETCDIETEIFDSDKIIIFVQNVDNEIFKNFKTNGNNDRRFYILNTEQATVNRRIKYLIKDVQEYNLPVIDYSAENIAILSQKFPETQFIHLPFPVQFKKPKKTTNRQKRKQQEKQQQEKQINIISLLSSDYRRQICSDLNQPIENFKGKWGEKRDNLIKNSKVLLNIHFDQNEYQIFENIRCYHALEMNTLVLSEHSYDESKVALRDFIIFCQVDQIDKTLSDILDNYDNYYQQYFGQTSQRKMTKIIKDIYTTNLNILLTNLHKKTN